MYIKVDSFSLSIKEKTVGPAPYYPKDGKLIQINARFQQLP
jgi:hypothetical protein